MKHISKKHYYLLACVVSWIAIALVITFWRTNEQAVSYIVNNHVLAYIVLQIATVSFIALVVQFLQGYFFAHIRATKFFRYNYYAALLMTFITNVIPSSTDGETDVHLGLGYITILVNLVLYIQLCSNKYIQRWIRLGIPMFLLLGVWLFLAFESLVAQATYILIGQGVILTIAYVKSAQPRIHA